MTAKRRLIVMRHAKAGELPGGPDAERALRPRGRDDAAAAGAWLRVGGRIPELVLCSPARRARQTWQYASQALGPAGGPEVRVDQRLYQAGPEELLEIFAEVTPVVTSLMYVGHNPAAAAVAAILAGREIAFPTAAIAVLGLAGGWETLADQPAAAGSCELVAAWTPKAGG